MLFLCKIPTKRNKNSNRIEIYTFIIFPAFITQNIFVFDTSGELLFESWVYKKWIFDLIPRCTKFFTYVVFPHILIGFDFVDFRFYLNQFRMNGTKQNRMNNNDNNDDDDNDDDVDVDDNNNNDA